MDEENVLDFLTSLEAMDLPDRIEEVNARILSKIVQDTDYVAVLFCEYDHICTRLFGRQKYRRNERVFLSSSVMCFIELIICSCGAK